MITGWYVQHAAIWHWYIFAIMLFYFFVIVSMHSFYIYIFVLNLVSINEMEIHLAFHALDFFRDKGGI